jgi:hypothetical protein
MDKHPNGLVEFTCNSSVYYFQCWKGSITTGNIKVRSALRELDHVLYTGESKGFTVGTYRLLIPIEFQ